MQYSSRSSMSASVPSQSNTIPFKMSHSSLVVLCNSVDVRLVTYRIFQNILGKSLGPEALNMMKQSFLETTPKWLSITLVLSAAALVVTGLGVFLGLAVTSTVGPFTLLLHFVWAAAISAWVVNLRTSLRPEKKSLLAIGVAIAVGSIWSSAQQWLAYLGTGVVNDIVLVVGAMLMDAAGGAVTYTLYRLNVLGHQ